MSRSPGRPLPYGSVGLALRALEPLLLALLTFALFHTLKLKSAARELMGNLRLNPRHVLVMAMLFYALVFFYFTAQRHAHFNSNGFDLGIQDQVVWNTAHGRWYQSSLEVTNYLGDHFKPLVALLAPFYRL